MSIYSGLSLPSLWFVLHTSLSLLLIHTNMTTQHELRQQVRGLIDRLSFTMQEHVPYTTQLRDLESVRDLLNVTLLASVSAQPSPPSSTVVVNKRRASVVQDSPAPKRVKGTSSPLLLPRKLCTDMPLSSVLPRPKRGHVSTQLRQQRRWTLCFLPRIRPARLSKDFGAAPRADQAGRRTGAPGRRLEGRKGVGSFPAELGLLLGKRGDTVAPQRHGLREDSPPTLGILGFQHFQGWGWLLEVRKTSRLLPEPLRQGRPGQARHSRHAPRTSGRPAQDFGRGFPACWSGRGPSKTGLYLSEASA